MHEPDVIVIGGPERPVRGAVQRAVRIGLGVVLALVAGGWLVLSHPSGDRAVALPSPTPAPPPTGIALAQSGGYTMHWDTTEHIFTVAFEVTNLAIRAVRVTAVDVSVSACLPPATVSLVPTPQDSMRINTDDRLVPVTVPLVLERGAAATVVVRCRVDCQAARLTSKDGDRVVLLLDDQRRYPLADPPQLSRLADQACSEPIP